MSLILRGYVVMKSCLGAFFSFEISLFIVMLHDLRFSVLPLVYIHLKGVFVVGDNSALLNVLGHIYNHHIIAARDFKKQSKVGFLALFMRV